MTVKELIEKLSECDPNKTVWIDYGGTMMPSEYVIDVEDRVYIE